MHPFEFDPSAVEETHKVEHQELPMIDFSGFADLAMKHAGGADPGASIIPDPVGRAVYFGALLDVHRLVEEYRFHVGFAYLIVFDVFEKIKRGDPSVERREPDAAFADLGVPDEARALMLPYMRQTPSAVQLFADPHVLITGDRRFSGWVAGQMIDSALVRGVAACDRFATMLWVRAGLPLETGKDQTIHLPDFTGRWLAGLDGHYAGRTAWTQLREIHENPVFTAVKRIRNGFTHARRIASELHGEKVVTTVSGPTDQGNALEVMALDQHTLENYAYVARKFAETSRRRENLSWSHHEAVAALVPAKSTLGRISRSASASTTSFSFRLLTTRELFSRSKRDWLRHPGGLRSPRACLGDSAPRSHRLGRSARGRPRRHPTARPTHRRRPHGPN